jgi:hypothetical protein
MGNVDTGLSAGALDDIFERVNDPRIFGTIVVYFVCIHGYSLIGATGS